MGFLFALALVHTHLYDAFLVSIGMNMTYSPLF